MNLHIDLKKAHIPHSCKSCCRKCINRAEACESFYPENMREFLDYAINTLRGTVEPSREKTMKRNVINDSRSYNDGITTLDGYYVQLINTALAEIRRGKADYLYCFEQIRDVIRFEPDITARYIAEAGAYEIRKGAV